MNPADSRRKHRLSHCTQNGRDDSGINSFFLKINQKRERYSSVEPVLTTFGLLALPGHLWLAPSFLVLLVNRNIQNVDLIVNLVVDILLLLLGKVLRCPRQLTAFELFQPGLHGVILLGYFVNNLQQFLDLEGFVRLSSVVTVHLPPQTIQLPLFLIDDAVFQLHRLIPTFIILFCSYFIILLSFFITSIRSVKYPM